MKVGKHKVSLGLRGLCHMRWNVPVLSAFGEMGGQARFVMLQHRLGVSRSSLERSLESLICLGLVRRNEGYGHPLRPEYLLTGAGKRASEPSTGLMRQLTKLGLMDVGLRKWSIPLTHVVPKHGGRFNWLQSELTGITPRALARTLTNLEDADWIERRLYDDRPPRSLYVLSPRIRVVAQLTGELQRQLG